MSSLSKLLAAVAAAVVLLAACDAQKIMKLEEGVSTEADVKKQFGEPTAVFPNADGSRTFEYTRQPSGQENYFITIGADGKMASLRQVLKATELAKIVPGMDKDQVRRAIGRPAKSQKFDLKPDEEHWDWRWLDGQQSKIFTATFDPSGKVIKTGVMDDPAVAMPGGK
jgi:outer membrane protein assembly factor BamE (lipoprotein component of BamABCDE complex)